MSERFVTKARRTRNPFVYKAVRRGLRFFVMYRCDIRHAVYESMLPAMSSYDRRRAAWSYVIVTIMTSSA